MRRHPLIITLASAVACSPVDGGFGETGATLRGRVVRADGTAAGALKIHVRGADGRTAIATADDGGRFALADPPLGSVRLLGHDGRGEGLRQEASLTDGGENDLGDIIMRPLAELPAMVTEPGLGLEERVTELSGNCLHAVFSSDHQRAYCLRTRGDSTVVDVVEIEIATGAVRVIESNDAPDGFDCPHSLRLLDDTVLLRVLRARNVVYGLGPNGLRASRSILDESCYPALDAVVDGQFVHWLDFQDAGLVTVPVDGGPVPNPPAAIRVPRAPDDTARVRDPLATSATRIAARLGVVDPGVVLGEDQPASIQIFDLVGRTVTVAYPSTPDYAISFGAFVGDELRGIARAGIVGFDAQGQQRLIAAGPSWVNFDEFVLQSSGSTGVFMVSSEFGERAAYRFDLVAGTITAPDYGQAGPPPSWTDQWRGSRIHANGDLATVYANTSSGSPSFLAETFFHPDGTADHHTFETRDDEESGPISRVITADGARTALLLVDPATGFRQVHEGPYEVEPAQRTFIAGSHTVLDYSADGSALHFFGLDPLSGYIQLFRLTTTEAPPAP